jgi:chromosome segregation ATPase
VGELTVLNARKRKIQRQLEKLGQEELKYTQRLEQNRRDLEKAALAPAAISSLVPLFEKDIEVCETELERIARLKQVLGQEWSEISSSPPQEFAA